MFTPTFTTSFHPFQLNIEGELHTFSQPVVMGILNITEDSFFDGGRYTQLEQAIHQVEIMLDEGAGMIDIGASSSRPGSVPVDEETELKRLIPVIKEIRRRFRDALISVDTFRANVAAKCVEAGAHIINDISAGDDDNTMLEMVAHLRVPYIIMHKQGTTRDMQKAPVYSNVVSEVTQYLAAKLERCYALNIHDVIWDPGFGFGKSVDHNYELMHGLAQMNYLLEAPMLVGVSRKSMITKLLGVTPDQALNGTTALNLYALLSGASILRVHDVREAREVVEIHQKLT
ncbi:MAG: dihydropteroate synthase [Bacteroidetes bacterium]|nr:dihydropteroate synthase [Bacteroidota bacterium]